jgi:hypothetical protein
MSVQQSLADTSLQGKAVVGVATPPELSALYRDLMSPCMTHVFAAGRGNPHSDGA